MKARCGLEDCDCEYTIGKLLAALKGLSKTMREQLTSLIDSGKVDGSKTRAAFEQADTIIDETEKE